MKELTPEEYHVIVEKGTERPFSGEFNQHEAAGTYTCRRCGVPLYRSEDKFDSGCGWPAFDDEIAGAVSRSVDADGQRVEITCSACGGHLGHVFVGEHLTDKNTRHCVNSLSLAFVPQLETAIFAGGCFWGVEHLMQQQEGVISVESGYTGGYVENPSYRQVCSKTTGHVEAVRVTYDPSKVSYETLAKLFFEIHDPTQQDGQGPDLGPQYLSEVFYADERQKLVAQQLMDTLRARGYQLATKLRPATTFFPAEAEHQDYYERKGTLPYCHSRVRRF
ncbi:MAG: bifunctional methionine sulfoxide reductase B/A protein [Akkermansia sp.]